MSKKVNMNRLQMRRAERQERQGVRLEGLTACRLAAALTQKELARLVGKSQTTIADLEKWDKADSAMVQALCRALIVEPPDLYHRGAVELSEVGRDEAMTDPTTARLLGRVSQVNRIKRGGHYAHPFSDHIDGLPPGIVLVRGLKARRLASGLTQRELARRIDSNQSTIVKLEKRYAPRGAYTKTIRKLCLALDVSPADLMCSPEKEGGRPG